MAGRSAAAARPKDQTAIGDASLRLTGRTTIPGGGGNTRHTTNGSSGAIDRDLLHLRALLATTFRLAFLFQIFCFIGVADAVRLRTLRFKSLAANAFV